MTKEMSSVVVLLLSCLCLFITTATTAGAAHNKCLSQWCGKHNISDPFRLEDSPSQCGDHRYTLSCEEDHQLVLYWRSRKFNVQSINYNNYTIRLLDANISHDYTSRPPYYSLPYDYHRYELYPLSYDYHELTTLVVVYLRCPNDVIATATATCMTNDSDALGTAFYLVSVFHKRLQDFAVADSCRIEWMYPSSWPAERESNSCTGVRTLLLYGFELSWFPALYKSSIIESIGLLLRSAATVAALYVLAKSVLFGVPFLILLCIYKWRRRHLSVYPTIEDFLQSDNSIMPIRYSYRDIKNITGVFKTKLGNGGYGSVFQGKLRSSRLVAVKLLNKAKSNGQEFINEVATIGRIHHVNIVQLIGFCVEGSKRALIYELMENGSLEKYIFSPQKNDSLSCEKLYTISLGVARGIEYLHNGCDMKILHFDIKPHNILLDENFNPKVSDFGLARLSPTDKSIVSMTAARGTIGYMAPELFYRNVGAISYKADVYSFGMLLMEMASRRKNLNAQTENSSQIYFPFWVYDELQDGREITIENDTDEEMKLAKRMMIVALWCIQTRPNDRPSMKRVVEMLEQDDDLEMPPKPYFYPLDALTEENVEDTTTHNSSKLSSGDVSSVSDSKE
ncbi:rust resistance kinase Lr10-like [Arachis hypogaea]|uniref:rust resistance kinase Lr10-like n=1 Tax=Arachis hypogaea TaxID=3818 RepID=UPI000DEC6623|nr:rust resistance kinase Lr10-like [Arachis hypogaea]QHN93746.1 putative receptor-like protein kinase [Arachis hypogaea]